MDEKDTKEQKPADTGKGDNPETTEPTKLEDANIERVEKLEQLKKENLDREDERALVKLRGGGSPAGQTPKKPEVLSDIDYAKKVALGAANPLVEDGFN